MKTTKRANVLADWWWQGVRAVSGRQCVADYLDGRQVPRFDRLIAVGKAASGMCQGALPYLAECGSALVVTREGHAETDPDSRVEVIESGHPLPNAESIRAGRAVMDAVREAAATDRLLLLVSGGASALAEMLPPGISLEDWRHTSESLIASGQSIADINARRSEISLIKGGKLLREFPGREILVIALSDVEGDDIGVIGSGLGDTVLARAPADAVVVGSNSLAREAVENAATLAGYPVLLNEESLYRDVFELAPALGRVLETGPAGVYVWGGEPVIELPEPPGFGGRNQSLALAIGCEISGARNVSVIVAGTDGSDGPTDYAGAIVDGDTVTDLDAARAALDAADAGTFLGAAGCLFKTGPTGTNVMDLVVALVE